MAINTYLQKCDYRLGGLKNYIYLVSKNALKINIKAKGIEVFWKKTKAGDILKVEGALVVFSQEESNNPKYRFQNKLEVTVEEKWEEPFLYALRTLRTNQYYIIIEDKKGNQYLVNSELFTDLNYEYNFNDGGDSSNNVLLTFFNLCNYPLLIMKEKIDNNLFLTNTQCDYNLGKINELVMISHKDLKVNDDGVKVNEIYVDDTAKIKRIDYLDDSCSINEEYNNKEFKCTLKFSIPLDDNQFNWHYDLLEYQDNKYCAIARTSNHNYIIMGMEIGMTPKYNIQTSDDVDTPNVVEITFTQISQYPIVYSNNVDIFDWRDEGERRCFGFDKYQMLTQYMTPDWGKTWIKSDPIVKKKGKLIEKNSADCTEIQWVDDGGSCVYKDTYYEKWVNTKEFICEKGNKYTKTRRYTSTDKDFWTPTDVYGVGGLVERNSADCMYVAVRWINSDDVICAEVDESKTKWEFGVEECHGTNYVKVDRELVTNNSIDFYPSGVSKDTILIPNCCACGYYQIERRYNKDVCYNEVKNRNNNIFESQDSKYPIRLEQYCKYEEYLQYKVCDDGHTTTDTLIPDSEIYIVKERNSCDCGYVGFDFYLTGHICGSEIGNGYDAHSKYEVWEEMNSCTKEKTGAVQYRKPVKSCDCGHRIYEERFEGEYICGSEIGVEYDAHSKYEIWNQHALCPDDPNIDEIVPNTTTYRNPVKSYDCGYQTYQWRIENEEICGNAAPQNADVVFNEPEINVDKPYENGNKEIQ